MAKPPIDLFRALCKSGGVAPPGTTKFGIHAGTPFLCTEDKFNLAQTMGVNYVRTTELISTYNNNQSIPWYDKCVARKAAGLQPIHLILNLDWENNSTSTTLFASSKTTKANYQSKMNVVLDDYLVDPSIVVVVVIENEPFNDGYFRGNDQDTIDYSIMLQWAIEVCHARTPRVLVADGCTHIPFILGVKQKIANSQPLNGNWKQTDDAFTLYQAFPDPLDFINMHMKGDESPTSPQPGEYAEAAQYLRDRTGVQNVMSNEHSIHTINTAIAVDMVRQAREANLFYSVPYGNDYINGQPQGWDSAQGKGAPFGTNPATCGGSFTLTNIGIALRDEIATPS